METRRDVFQAIADPTRRAIINMIAHDAMNLNTIAENFDVTRQAISLHIKILDECGLIAIKKQGRERFCEAKLDKLEEITQWIGKIEQVKEQTKTPVKIAKTIVKTPKAIVAKQPVVPTNIPVETPPPVMQPEKAQDKKTETDDDYLDHFNW